MKTISIEQQKLQAQEILEEEARKQRLAKLYDDFSDEETGQTKANMMAYMSKVE